MISLLLLEKKNMNFGKIPYSSHKLPMIGGGEVV